MTYSELQARQRGQVKKVLRVLANNIPKGSEKLVTDFDQLLEYGVFPEMLITPQAQKTVGEARKNLYYVVAGECAYNKFFFLHEGRCEDHISEYLVHQKVVEYTQTYESYLEATEALVNEYAQDRLPMVLLNVKALKDLQKDRGFGSYFYLIYEAVSLYNISRFEDARRVAEEFFKRFPEVTLGTTYNLMKACLKPVEGEEASTEVILGYDIPWEADDGD